MTAARRQDRRHLVSVDEIARMMEGRILELVREQWGLDGHVDGKNFVAKNPLRNDRSAGSFMVAIDGSLKGLVKDFASGETWTLLQFTAALSFSGDINAAIKWAKAWVGLDGTDPTSLRRSRAAIQEADAAAEIRAAKQAEDDEKERKTAYRRYLEANPEIIGTPVDIYLGGRAIDIRRFDFPLRALRFHPALYNHESQRRWPAMVAPIVSMSGLFLAVHRTWLEVHPDGSVTKAPLKRPKKVMGKCRAGLIRLWNGIRIDPVTGEVKRGQKLAQVKAGAIIDITEGIEDGLSVALAMPNLRVAAGVSVDNLQSLKLPDNVAGLTFWKQNDLPGSAADKGFYRVVANIQAQGKAVRIVRPPAGVKDPNDVLKGEQSTDDGGEKA